MQMKKIARRQQQQQQQQQEQDQLGNPRLGSGRGTGRNSRQSNDDSEGEELGGMLKVLGVAGWVGGIGSNRSERECTRGLSGSRQVVAELVCKLSVTPTVEWCWEMLGGTQGYSRCSMPLLFLGRGSFYNLALMFITSHPCCVDALGLMQC